MQKLTSITPFIFEIIHFESIFQELCSEIFYQFQGLSLTVGPVTLELFRLSVVRGPCLGRLTSMTEINLLWI